jgi:hypothetical protein
MIWNAGAGGIGLLLVGLAGVLIWKDHAPKARAWLALVGGAFAAGTIVSWLGGMAYASIAGASIFLVILVVGGLVFWLEAIKGKKPHKVRTPVIGLAVGVALTASFGGVQHVVQQSTVNLTSVVSHHTGR